MTFSDFIKEGKVKRSSPDLELSKSLIKCAEQDLEFLKNLPVTETSARKIIISYYDPLRSILEAIAAREGYKIYSYEAYTFYLNEKKESLLSLKFDRFRKLRNKLNYYGGSITVLEAIDFKQEMINALKRYLQ